MQASPMVRSKTSLQKAILIYILASLFLVYEMAVQVSPSVMAVRLMRELELGAFSLGLMSGFYFYTYTLMQIPSGLLFDRFKPRLIITISILVCAIGSLIFGLAQNFYFGCVARLLTGFGSAFAFVAVLVVASDLFRPQLFATLVGITQMLAAFGAMLGQMPVSILVGHFGWRNTMFIISAVGFLLALCVWLLMKYESLPDPEPIHFSESPNIKQSLKIILGNRQTWVVAFYACLLWAPMSGFASLWGVAFLRQAEGLTANLAAFYCSFMWLGLALASPLLGMVSSAVNNKKWPLAVVAIIGMMAFGLLMFGHYTGLSLAILLLLAGGACAGQALSFAVVRDINCHSVKATAIGFNNMAVVISGAIVQPLIGRLIALGNHGYINLYSLADYKRGMWIIFVAYILASITAVMFLKEPSK